MFVQKYHANSARRPTIRPLQILPRDVFHFCRRFCLSRFCAGARRRTRICRLLRGRARPTPFDQDQLQINWSSKDGKLYCFSSEAAKAEFLKSPEENIARATDNYAANAIEQIAGGMDKYTSDDAQDFIDKYIKAAAAKTGGAFVVNVATASSIPLVYDKVDFTPDAGRLWSFPTSSFMLAAMPQRHISSFLGRAAGRQARHHGNPHLRSAGQGWHTHGDPGAPAGALVVDSGFGASRPDRTKAQLGDHVGVSMAISPPKRPHIMAC